MVSCFQDDDPRVPPRRELGDLVKKMNESFGTEERQQLPSDTRKVSMEVKQTRLGFVPLKFQP